MRWLWRNLGARPASDDPSTDVSPEFRHALTREIMKTEAVRVSAVIVVILGLAVISSALYFFSPAEVERIWHGQLNLIYVWAILGPFVAFEFAVLQLIKRQI